MLANLTIGVCKFTPPPLFMQNFDILREKDENCNPGFMARRN